MTMTMTRILAKQQADHAAYRTAAEQAGEGYQVETYNGAQAGWQPASPAVMPLATAEARLRLYRAVRGSWRIYRLTRVL